MEHLLLALSSGDGAATGSGQMSYIILMVVMLAAMYFFMIRPQKKRQKQEQEMRNSIEIGDEIVTIGGIIGRVVTVKDDSLVIETGADKLKMKVERWAVGTNKTKQDQYQKEVQAAKEAAAAKKAEKSKKKNKKED